MSGLPKKRCSKANDDSNPAEETVKGGACRKNRLRSLSDREGFSLKHLALEERRKRLVESLGLKKEEYAALLAENTAEAKAKAEKIIKKAAFELKYGYVYGGHVKNEILGMLTVYNLGRSFSVRARRKIRFDPTDDKLYLNTYQYLRRDSSKKAKVFVYIHGGGWIGGWPESREAFTTRVASAGFFVVSVYYGEAPKYSHPKMIENIYIKPSDMSGITPTNGMSMSVPSLSEGSPQAHTLRRWRAAFPQIPNIKCISISILAQRTFRLRDWC